MGLLVFALAAGPVFAQDSANTTNSATGAPASQVVSGPQLRDFNLNGTVTRPAETETPTTPPARPVTAPPRQQETARPAAPSATAAASRAPAQTEAAQRSRPAPASTPSQSASVQTQPVQAPVAASPAPIAPAAAAPLVPLPGEPASDFALWPWLLAALVAAGGALYLYRSRLQRDRYALAGGGDSAAELRAEPDAAAEPLRRALLPSPPPPKPASIGVVSTSLHPNLDIDLLPERAVVDENGATIEFQVAVRNRGTAPARDVRVEACMVNAGPSQDQELGAFFAHPSVKGEPVPHIMPMTEIVMKSAVRLSPDQMRQFDVGGRKLFVPLVGVNTIYRGPSGQKQTSASYLVGRDGNGEKMAPFRLDLGPRIFRGLGARRHTLALRS